jgi:hypothetical protein
MPGCTQQRGAQKHLGYLQDRRLPLETCPNGRRRDLHSDITLPDISLRAPPGMMLRFGRQPRAMRPALLGTQVSTSEVSGIVTVTSFPSSDLQSTQRSLQLCSVESQHQAWHRPGCAMRRGTYHVCANFVYWDSDMVMIRAWEACFPSPAVPAHIASDVWVNFVILQSQLTRSPAGGWILERLPPNTSHGVGAIQFQQRMVYHPLTLPDDLGACASASRCFAHRRDPKRKLAPPRGSLALQQHGSTAEWVAAPSRRQ